ncbi:MAG TPA: VCBS repeat-containing protein [Puia sp.]|nr:VCBS repeat-containing protein [Puia sp.]
MTHSSKYLLLISFVFLFSCTQKKDAPLFELEKQTGIDFVNTLEDTRTDNIFKFRNYYNGGGVAIGDINNDGLPDVLLTSNMGDNKLYLNKGNFKFDDITKTSGMHQDSMWSTGVVLADINNDGWLDIYICNSGHMSDGNRRNKLYINNHNLTFTDSAAQYGLDISAYTTQVSFFDYDNDGDLDCFVINNSPIPVNTLNNSNRRDLPDSAWPIAANLKGGGDHLYRNDNGHFKEVTREAGIHGGLIGFGLGVSVGDLNADGYPDIFVSNDSYERDYLYINQKNGTFKDELEQRFRHTSYSSMGADIADINNDGSPELFTTDMLPGDDYRLKTLGSFDNIDLYSAKENAGFYHQYVKNCLQLNDKTGKFIDIADYSGVSATDWSWGALMFDMDNDGFNDIFVCNGINKDLTNLDFMDFFANDVIKDMVATGKKDEMEDVLKRIPVTPMLHKAFHNNGDLHFSDRGIDWGFTQPSFSNGAAYGDLDNDGDLDLIISNVNGPAFVYRNNASETTGNNYISVLLKGTAKNRFAIGSTIRLYKGDTVISRELIPSRGFQSSMDYRQVLGLGKMTKPDSLLIIWPDNTFTKLDHPQINKLYTLQQGDQNNRYSWPKPPDSTQTLLRRLPALFEKHVEDEYEDFHYERNLPKMSSREGPRTSVGDVNGDGLPDVFIGGTAGHPGQLYLQTPTGFQRSKQPGFDLFSDFEDEAVLFFDADHDGDLDLFIGPGGNNVPPNSRQLQLRLFRNDGKGNFTLDIAAFPGNNNNSDISTAVAGDFNHDGFPDLFVGGHDIPREYGAAPSSYIFLNDGKGHFTDIANTKNPDIAGIGMVTAALWENLGGDNTGQLVICGEWMPTRIFSWDNDHFTELHNTGLDNLSGWWQTLAAADLNGDGKKDLVLGNIGENFYLHPDAVHPVKCWIKDFDNNGITDKVLTRTVEGKDVPVFLKHDLENAIPGLKKQNLKHKDFAQRSISDLFTPSDLDSALVRIFNYPSSVVAINEGHGKFSVHKLPVLTQMSSANAIRCLDVNNDGFTDLVIGGNEYGFLPQFGRLDASQGLILLNDGKGQFTTLSSARSGLDLPGQIRDIALVPAKDHIYLLFLANDEPPVLYTLPGTTTSKK